MGLSGPGGGSWGADRRGLRWRHAAWLLQFFGRGRLRTEEWHAPVAFLSAQGHLVDAEGDCSAALQHLHTSVCGCRVSRRFVLQVFGVRTSC